MTVVEEKRGRGRPQIRTDDETREVIVEAANDQFKKDGFASASMNSIAKTAGVSTKTLYRLFPAKPDLFTDVVARKIKQFFVGLDEESLKDATTAEGLERLLVAFGRLTLSSDTIAITRLVLSESDRFPEIASVFYEQAISRTSAAMETWLTQQCEAKAIRLKDVKAATGMLRGMMAMEPQRSVMLGKSLEIPDNVIVERARQCADLFLHGCAGSSD